MATSKQLDELTKCSICTQVYTDPRVLPCGHTFCFKCLETYSKARQPEEDLACPMCRKELTLPSGGVEDLPKNCFVSKVVQMKELSSFDSNVMTPCEACSGGGDGEAELQNVASVYCVECHIRLCQNCERGHSAIKLTRSHKLVEIGVEVSVKLLDKLCKQMAVDLGNVLAGMEKCREMVDSLEKEKEDLEEQVTRRENEISRFAEQLKKMIDSHRQSMMYELSVMKQKRLKEIESLHGGMERQLMSMESYKKYVEEVKRKRSAADIARTAGGLHDRAEELLAMDVIERMLFELGHAEVTFLSSSVIIDDVGTTLGKLGLDISKPAMKSRVPRLAHVIPSQGRGSVYALTSLGDEVYVVRWCSQQVEVYDAVTFELQRHITVPRLGSHPYGLAACAVYQCIYLSDWYNFTIHRVELASSNEVKKWSVADSPTSLSVNMSNNLVVTCQEANKLQEYTTRGFLVREICMQGDVTDPWHAIQLSTGDYVVSQFTSPGVVSVVGVDGQVLCSYGPSETSDIGCMRYPRSLAVTKSDDILVADKDNKRILSIAPSGIVQVLALSVEDGIQEPLGLCLDESRGRLYVGERDGERRVLVFGRVRPGAPL